MLVGCGCVAHAGTPSKLSPPFSCSRLRATLTSPRRCLHRVQRGGKIAYQAGLIDAAALNVIFKMLPEATQDGPVFLSLLQLCVCLLRDMVRDQVRLRASSTSLESRTR